MYTERRKYRGPEFGVNIGTSVSPKTFDRIENLTNEYGLKKAEIVRRLILRGLAEYDRDGQLSSAAAMSADGHISHLESIT